MALVGLMTLNVDINRETLGLVVPYYCNTALIAPYFDMLLIFAIINFVLLTVLVPSHIGLAFRAIRQNPLAAGASGEKPTKYKVLNWTVACAFASLLGASYARFIGFHTPDIMHIRHTVRFLTLSSSGGRGSLWGGLLSFFIVTPTFESPKPLLETRLIINGLQLVSTMMFYPSRLVCVLRSVGNLLVRATIRPKESMRVQSW
jgi:branched-chain amino acid transport system permease protein